ncbi:MAG: endonuclease/exonuclease/phosphatase family protein [Candidatus Dojkabacteria bacterium]
MRIVTLNMYCRREWNMKKDTLLSNLREIDPEIFCAQEITGREIESGQYVYEGIELEKRLKYDGYYSSEITPDTNTNQGIFLKPKTFGVKDSQQTSLSGILPTGEIDRHRRFLLAQLLEIDGEEILIVNLHLSTTKAFRYQNWREFLIWLKSMKYEEKNIVVVGDFNTYEHEDVHIEVLKSGFSNAWESVREEKCVTYYSSQYWLDNMPEDPISQGIRKHNKYWEEGCLDYVFYRGNIDIKSIVYLDLVPEYTDHKGLVVDLELI